MTDIFQYLGELAMQNTGAIMLMVLVLGVMFVYSIIESQTSSRLFVAIIAVFAFLSSAGAYALTRTIPEGKVEVLHSSGAISDCVLSRLEKTDSGYLYFKKPVQYVTVNQIQNRYC